jgi:adenosylcobinamide-GDP ribazoletransferase
VQAARYLTIVPVGGRVPHEHAGALGAAAAWFPVVGLGLGAVLAVTDLAAQQLFPSLLGALVTVTAWKLLTGGLHLDGLADCLDGLAGHDASQRLRIMSDARIGAFGAIGLILFLMLEIGAVSELAGAGRWRVLLAAPTIGRALPPVLARCFTAARPAGAGAAFLGGVRPRDAALALGLAVVIAGAALGPTGVLALVVAALVALALARFLATRLGGITGDVLGAAVETSELAVLLTVSAWMHALAR